MCLAKENPVSSILRIVGLTGCLREKSYNRAALRTAQQLLSPHVELELLSLDDLPAFTQAQDEPVAVRQLKEQVRQADAVLIATPEYKGLLPNALKNTLCWLGEPAEESVLAGKPVAIMGIGRQSGAANEQQQLRQLLATCQATLLEQPELYIPSQGQQFSASGELTDVQTRQQIRALLDALVARVPVLVG
jgi:chromate reductase, NAD(P)H dehydrogenase (quinone)